MDATTTQSLAWLVEATPPEQRATISRLFPLIYEELRQVAERYMRAESRHHTLQPTALVHEAFMRVQAGGVRVQGERHALAVAAVAMRHILVDHARKRSALKRGGAAQRLTLDGREGGAMRELEIIELDDLLTRYAELDVRRARVVELRVFAGMTNDEIAGALSIARSTVADDWALARAWLRVQLKRDFAHD